MYVHETPRNRYITEYYATIDSIDRNTLAYPSPFNFRTAFDVASDPAPHIPKRCHHVKYITLNSVIIPKSVAVDITHVAEPNLYPASSTYTTGIAASTDILTLSKNNAFLQVVFDNVYDNTLLDTHGTRSNKFTLTYDSDVGIDNTLWKPTHSTIVFQDTRLAQFERLDLSLRNVYGDEFNIVDTTGNRLINSALLNGVDYLTFISNNSSVPSVKHTNRSIQVVYDFTIGIVNAEIPGYQRY